MDLKFYLAIIVGKLIEKLIKLTGGGATAAPGLYALKIDPELVKKLMNKVKHGSIIVSGTNGKTTTARLLFDILSTKYRIIHNRQGSNLLRGIASTLIAHFSSQGNLKFDLAIWEVDEATLPEAINNVYPKTIILLNLFRDQLDRYGEVDSVRNNWQKALRNLSSNVTLILNSDDPGISILEKSFRGRKIFFGVNDRKVNLPKMASVVDIKHCLICGSDLIFNALLSAHLGHYECSNCEFKRPQADIAAKNLKFNKDFSTSAQLIISHSSFKIHYSLPGLYNVYNILASTAAAKNLGINSQITVNKIRIFSAAFGKNVITLLVKNPAGANEVLRTISKLPKINLLAILNDKIADGRDVSWIWDTNWEVLEGRFNYASVSGIRRLDLATRLKYAGIKLSKKNIYKDISYSIINSVNKLSNSDTLIILPTYTALLDVQKALHNIGGIILKWQEQ